MTTTTKYIVGVSQTELSRATVRRVQHIDDPKHKQHEHVQSISIVWGCCFWARGLLPALPLTSHGAAQAHQVCRPPATSMKQVRNPIKVSSGASLASPGPSWARDQPRANHSMMMNDEHRAVAGSEDPKESATAIATQQLSNAATQQLNNASFGPLEDAVLTVGPARSCKFAVPNTCGSDFRKT